MRINPETHAPVQTYYVTVEVVAESLGLASTRVEDALMLAGAEDATVISCNIVVLLDDEDEDA